MKVLRHIGAVVLLVLAALLLVSCLDMLPIGRTVSVYLDGRLIETVSVAEDGSFELPDVEVPTGYEFDGWYRDTDGTLTFDGGRRAYGFLRPIHYTLSYELDGGTADNPLSYTVETPTFSLAPPERRGYTFTGWLADGGQTPVLTLTVPKGTTGDLRLVATYEPTVYPITYELDGGTASNPTSYTVLTESFTLVPPTRDGYEFVAWEVGGTLYTSYAVEQGSVGPLTVRAVWNTGLPLLSYRADTDGITVRSNIQAGGVASNATVTVCAPATQGDLTFLYWKCNGNIASYAATYTFTMGSATRVLVACYAETERTVFDKAVGGDLGLMTGRAAVPYAAWGGGIGQLSDVAFSSGRATVSAEHLMTLPVGFYTVFVDDALGGDWFVIEVRDTRVTPSQITVTFDTVHHPAAVLTFTCACDGTHTYSLDGAAPVLCRSGDVLKNYDKAAAHTVRVTCSSGATGTVVRDAVATGAMSFADRTFTLGAQTYDYLIESVEELSVFFDYCILVQGVLDYGGGAEAMTYEFCTSAELAEQLAVDSSYEQLIDEVFASKSFPMGPSIQISYRAVSPYRCSLTVAYPDGLNAVVSTHTPVYIDDTANLRPTSGRAAGAALPIDAFPTITIRTLYELEDMPYGYRPVFAASAADAAAVYARAREILLSVVDDTMNDYEKVAAIYRYIAANVTYDDVAYASPDASKYRCFTAFGALMDGLAVCDGYASAFRLLCLMEGINCEECVGRQDPSDPSSGHAWNKYIIDGVAYGCDVTWSRIGDEYITMYFLMLDEAQLLDSHHYEEAMIADPRVDVCADGMFTYYETFETQSGYTLDVDSVNGFIAAARYAMEHGLDVIEIRLTDGHLRMYLNAASDALRVSLSAVTASHDVCYILIDP